MDYAVPYEPAGTQAPPMPQGNNAMPQAYDPTQNPYSASGAPETGVPVLGSVPSNENG